jgi:hypothetical protein
MYKTQKLVFMIDNKIVAFVILSLAFNLQLIKSQSYVADTIRIKTQKKDSIQFRYSLKVVDHRIEDPRFISVYEKKKLLFFPIDQIVIDYRPVAEELLSCQNKGSSDNYLLNIHEFYIQQTSSLLKQNFKLNGTLELSELKNSDTTLMGTFYYEQVLPKSKKLNDSSGFSEALSLYTNQIIHDLNTVCDNVSGINKTGDYHFRKEVKAAPKNLYLTNDTYFGHNFWGLDAEICFSDPEPANKYSRNSRMLRYIKYSNHESMAISSKISLLNYRLSNHWLFQNKHAFLFGFNNWHDIDEAKRTFEELFLFQLTASQKIYYNTLDKKGITFGLGLMEGASYIIHNNPTFNMGFVFSYGYKF